MSVESVLLKIPLTHGTGYGNDGFSLSRALHQHGLDVRLRPTAITPPIPMPVAQLLTKDLSPDFDYLIHHVDPEALGLRDGERKMRAKKVAWTMWEFTRLHPSAAEDMTERLDGYDFLYVYDEVSAEAFAPHAEEAGVPMRVLQGGYWSDDWRYDVRQRDWSGPFRFCMVGQLHQRKNPFAAVNAFAEVREEFPEAELHLKTNIKTLHPMMEERYPGLKIHYDMWDHKRLYEFYARSHCYVAPSWGEGKNLPALEAQTMGVPVIYSDFGGHREWGSAEMGWPVKGTIEEHVPGLPSFRVDHDALVAAMKDAIRNRQNTKHKGEIASQYIPVQCDWSHVVRRLLESVNRP